MSPSSIRFWFCSAVAVIAAAVADPLVEWASNAGLFGRGTFTDHSMLDVLPALAVGGLFLVAHLALRIRRALANPPEANWLRASRDALRGGIARMLPAIFAMQIAILYVMETSEQYFVAGHVLGGTIWLGGPIVVSLAAHAIASVAIAFLTSLLLFVFTQTTMRAICMIRAMATRPAHGATPVELPLPAGCTAQLCTFVLDHIGERAPPLLA